MPLEHNDVEHPLWRKKVDDSLLRHSVTPLPGWAADMWDMRSTFPQKGSQRDPTPQVRLRFQNESFNGAVTWYYRGAEIILCRADSLASGTPPAGPQADPGVGLLLI